MMLIFFFGMGASALLCAWVQNAWQMAIALSVLGLFSAIYHPVGIPMLLQHADKPGQTIGINGLAGNMGIALAAILTGFMVKYVGWRAAFVLPGILSLVCGLLFMRLAPPETESPARRTTRARIGLGKQQMARMFMGRKTGGFIQPDRSRIEQDGREAGGFQISDFKLRFPISSRARMRRTRSARWGMGMPAAVARRRGSSQIGPSSTSRPAR